MVDLRARLQNQRHPHFPHNFWISTQPEGTYAVPSYEQRTQSQGYYHGLQTITRHARTTLAPEFPDNVATDAQAAAYEDVVVTKAWHDEWEVEPVDFGTTRPLSLLNRPVNIDLKNHSWRTMVVHLCYWDQDHEPDGAIAQRLARAKRLREKEQVAAYMSSEQDMRRKRVKQAARNAKVIDLTGDDAIRESMFRSFAGVEYAENYPPRTIAQPWWI